MRTDVVIVTRNHGATLAATLEGVTAQTVAPDRVVVVDNASTDGSAAVAASFADRLPLDVVRLDGNRGFAAAANEGFRRGSAPWVLSLNPDCRCEPEFVAELLAGAARAPRVGAVSGLLLRADGDTLSATDTVDSAGIVMSAGGRHHDRAAGEALSPELERPAMVFGATGAAALYRRDALDDVAYGAGEVYDEGFFAYREDADLAWRLQRRGWSCLYWPAARAYHRRGLRPEQHRRGTPVINRLSVRNRFLLRWSNADWRWHLACFPAWLVRDVLVVGACLTVERSSLPGLVEAWRRRPAQRRRGRSNAAAARVDSWEIARWFHSAGRIREVGV